MNKEDVEKIRRRLEEAFGEEAEAQITSGQDASDEGKLAITFYPRNSASWSGITFMCREVGVEIPQDMLVERVPDRFCAVTVFWGFNG